MFKSDGVENQEMEQVSCDPAIEPYRGVLQDTVTTSMGQQSRRKTVHRPCMTHQLANKLLLGSQSLVSQIVPLIPTAVNVFRGNLRRNDSPALQQYHCGKKYYISNSWRGSSCNVMQ